MRIDPILNELQAAFEVQRSSLLTEHAGQWALLIDGVPQPQFYETDIEAVAAGFSHRPSARFYINQVLEKDRPIIVPHVVIAD
ncbi:MAG: hypothetical protein OXT07_00595 [bacterium]|nr:hypothetical protein [bacterium]